ncbi:MAG: riboflavin biosynthesis protein RibF [Ruminococcaceae bacterium]|nr:riboflavin biosynthesis protein RibF [Oscillospiraceae bacterium]
MFFILNKTGKITQTIGIDPSKKYICALGCFDGVHIGHRSLIDTVVNDKSGLVPAIWTFSAPLTFPYIETVEKRLNLCGEYGIKFAFCEEYEDLKRMTPREFVKYLAEEMNVAHIVCGEDFRFGKDRAGDVEVLRHECDLFGVALTVKSPVMANIYGETVKVSSTVIKKLIQNGDVETANKLLGRPFTLKGVVINGNKIGRTISVPTVNQSLPKMRVSPRFGVYDSVFKVNGVSYPSVTNIGVRPTVNKNEDNITCETHIIGESLDLYGMIVEVEFRRFNRPEEKFANLADLKAQIKRDIEHSAEYYESREDI